MAILDALRAVVSQSLMPMSNQDQLLEFRQIREHNSISECRYADGVH